MNETALLLVEIDDNFFQLAGVEEGLGGYAMRVDNLEVEQTRLLEGGFAVSEISTHTHQHNERTITWKTAFVDNGIAPFLIQDVSPREWRVPTVFFDHNHKNCAIGVRRIEIGVQEIEAAWERYKLLLDLDLQHPRTGNYRYIGDVYLREYSINPELPEHFPARERPYGGKITLEELETVDPNLEPTWFEWQLDRYERDLKYFAVYKVRRLRIATLLREKQEALFSIHLISEQENNENFLDRNTCGAIFVHLVGVPSRRYQGVFIGLDKIDWSTLTHAYGNAIDIPELLYGLTSDNAYIRSQMGESLSNKIKHQGSTYSASIETMPFLLQLLLHPDVDSQIPSNLLASISAGGQRNPTLAERTQSKLNELFPIFLKNLDHEDTEVRFCVAKHLSLYEDRFDELVPLIQQRIINELDGEVSGELVNSLKVLWQTNASDKSLSEVQQNYLVAIMQDQSRPIAARYRAADVLVKEYPNKWIDTVMPIFHEMMQADGEIIFELSYKRLRWIVNIFYDVTCTLSDFPDRTFDWLLAQVNHPNAELRAGLIGHIASRATPERCAQIITIVQQYLVDSDPNVRQSTIWAIQKNLLDIDEFTDRLHSIVENDPSWMIRILAKELLASA